MSLHRRAAKRDDSEPEVVEALLDAGCTVVKHTGKNEADLFVAYQGRWYCVEVKTGSRRRTPEQEEWAKRMDAPVYECRTQAQARKLVTLWEMQASEAA